VLVIIVASDLSDGHLLGLALLCVVGVEFLQVLEGCSRVESLGAGKGAEADLVALAELHVSAKHLESLLGELVTGVNDPPVCLHEDSWPEVVLWMPPVRGAGRLAAGAENALI
jgi:hypothetical protein